MEQTKTALKKALHESLLATRVRGHNPLDIKDILQATAMITVGISALHYWQGLNSCLNSCYGNTEIALKISSGSH